ncbi:SH3 domain-containing protein [Spirochaeta cellobiosiphila]|uniref:SH3 domain-containing protein n=1 Tax=Spirochaeta cellobiosiphila TaxID=504483 RepID=UPI001469C968|nr:SH3 domain-containing protein [Spirochaeta cellobiosiphila]
MFSRKYQNDLYCESPYYDGNFRIYGYDTQNNVETYISIKDLSLENIVAILPSNIKNSVWLMNYYMDLFESNEPDIKKIIFYNDNSWNTWFNNLSINEPPPYPKWNERFKALYLVIKDQYIVASRSDYCQVNYILINQIVNSKNTFTISVYALNKESNSQIQPGYESLFQMDTPYNLIFVQDGDYLDMYIDSVNEDNHIFTYVRGTKEMAQEIEHFVRRESYDPSKILWPRHADGTSDYDKDIILNHTTGYSYLTLQNCNLLESPTLNSKAITELNKDEVITITEQGKEELIEGVQSHWLKVTTDDNKEGWVYGGNVSLNDAVSKTEQEQYKKEHDDLVKLTSKVEKQIEREAKKKQLIKNICNPPKN